MADGKKKSGQKQPDKKKSSSAAAQQVKAQAAAKMQAKPQPKPAPPKPKPKPKPAPKQAARPDANKYQIVQPDDLPAPVFSSPANIALLLLGAALLIGGAVIFAKIQYGHGATKEFFLGTALVIIGVLVPCIGIPRLRNIFIPKKTVDQYEIKTPDGKKS